MDYLKACRNVGFFKHQARITALKTMAVQKQLQTKCFNCGQIGHIKKECHLPPCLVAPSPAYRLNKSKIQPPIVGPYCRRGKHWAKECKSKTDKDGNPLGSPHQGNSLRGQPQAPINVGPGNYPIQFVPSSDSQ